MKKKQIPKIAFVGQGWIGKNYADNFESRGFEVTRYSLEAEYEKNKARVGGADVVFIAVPTPTRQGKVDSKIVEESLALVGKGSTAVIKSTIEPGTTKRFQKKFAHIYVLHSPEFLTKATAVYDTEHPARNIIGIPIESKTFRTKASSVLSLLPKAPYEIITGSDESEFIKYASNTFYYAKVVYFNILYDFAKKKKMNWPDIEASAAADPMTGPVHTKPIHKSGRGAGGICLIKDYAAFAALLGKTRLSAEAESVVEAIEVFNKKLLRDSGKDQQVIEEVYLKK